MSDLYIVEARRKHLLQGKGLVTDDRSPATRTALESMKRRPYLTSLLAVIEVGAAVGG